MVINQKQGTSYYQALMKLLLVLCSGNIQGCNNWHNSV